MAYGVGIIGLSASGGWAARAHVPALKAVDGLELRALSASNTKSGKAAEEMYGVPSSSPEDLVRRDDVDLVVVTVKVPEHRDLVLAAIEAGKAVLCEWPLGVDLAETTEVASAAEERRVRTFVGLQARSVPTIRYVRDLIAEGYVGEVLSTTIVGGGGNWGPTFTTRSAYQLDRANGATMLTIPFGHTVDALAMVLGEFTELTATTATRRPLVRNTDTGESAPMNAEDQIAVSGVLESGAVAVMHMYGGRDGGFRWDIRGTERDLTLLQDWAHPQFGQLTVSGLKTPDSYERVKIDPDDAAYGVAHAYQQIVDDLTTGARTVPDFAHAVRRHRLLERISSPDRTRS
jgi:predicted dehydrogenase